MNRRRFITTFGAFTVAAGLPRFAMGQAASLDVPSLKAGYALRLKKLLAAGALPYIDIESSCNSTKIDVQAVAKAMDELNIGLMALSADIGKNRFADGVRYDDLSQRLLASFPDRFIPIGNGGQPPALTDAPGEFLDAQEQAARDGKILLLGEYEFRHYPSPRQAKREPEERDVDIPLDGLEGHRLFRLSEATGLPFQIHYEIEDVLLPTLEKMLAQYPGARVVWCHLAQVRYLERASRYSPTYVEGLIQRFPGLCFDTAFGDGASVYPPSGQKHARIWNGEALKKEWRDLIVAHPRRFLSALDLGQDRMHRMHEYDAKHRRFLAQLPEEVRHQVAWRNAWRLMFGEEFG
ncbi:amidohydrolase family protein [Hylemonella sp. W303a]|uniref:amidohydrolase family protein n=1 Tax=Hylemonella sp. W303a TaxID=3389873 RepID=UPI00396B0759